MNAKGHHQWIWLLRVCAWKGLPKTPAALPSALNISSLSNVLQRKRSSCSYSHRVHLQEDGAFFRCKANPYVRSNISDRCSPSTKIYISLLLLLKTCIVIFYARFRSNFRIHILVTVTLTILLVPLIVSVY